MTAPSCLSPFQEHVARAAGNAASISKMAQAWALLDACPPRQAWEVFVDAARGQSHAIIVDFLQGQGKLSDLAVASELWRAAVLCQHKPIMEGLCQSSDFATTVAKDRSGVFLLDCLDCKFNGQAQASLLTLLALNPDQQALDACLSKALFKSFNASRTDGWPQMWDCLLGAGANPLAKVVDIKGSPSPPNTTDSILMAMAKQASLLQDNGAQHLASLACHAGARQVLGYSNKQGYHFAPMWIGGGGNVQSLVELLDSVVEDGPAWWDGDPFHVFPDALRLACVCNDPVLFEHLCLRASAEKLNNPLCDCAIVPIVNQAYRQSLLASSGTRHGSGWEVDGGFNSWKIVYGNSGSSLPKSDAPDYSFHINFWAKQAPSLATLFANPNQWKRACAIIAKSLPHVTKPTNSRIQSLVDGLELEFGSPPVDPTRKSSLRL